MSEADLTPEDEKEMNELVETIGKVTIAETFKMVLRGELKRADLTDIEVTHKILKGKAIIEIYIKLRGKLIKTLVFELVANNGTGMSNPKAN